MDQTTRAEATAWAYEEFGHANLGDPWVHVVVDGTSLRLTDLRRAKGFGAVGSTRNGASGLKVVHAYAVSKDGVPIGIAKSAVVGAPSEKQTCGLPQAPA